MKFLTWDSDFQYDDPNVYWGNPSYKLEPGDPGYIDPDPKPPSTTHKKKRRNTMPKQSFMPRQEGPKVNWLNKLTDALMDPLKGYAAKYGISSANMTKLDNGRKAVNWVWGNLEKVRAFPQQFTTFKDALFDGEGALGNLPLAPALSTPPVAATLYADVFGFALLLANGIKNHPDYSESDGEDMGLEGPELPPDDGGSAPVLKLVKSAPGDVVIGWTKGRHQGAKFQSRIAGTAAWVDLDVDLSPPYNDARPLAVAGVPEVREYRACYVDDETPSNVWSDVLVVTVGP